MWAAPEGARAHDVGGAPDHGPRSPGIPGPPALAPNPGHGRTRPLSLN